MNLATSQQVCATLRPHPGARRIVGTDSRRVPWAEGKLSFDKKQTARVFQLVDRLAMEAATVREDERGTFIRNAVDDLRKRFNSKYIKQPERLRSAMAFTDHVEKLAEDALTSRRNGP
jgi:hypothetical protein